MLEQAKGVEQIERPLGPPGKLQGYELYRFIGSPKMLLAPMVEMSELPWRVLSCVYGAQLCYTPMIHAKLMVTHCTNACDRRILNKYYDARLKEHIDFTRLNELNVTEDIINLPLIAQFCANDAKELLEAATIVSEQGHIVAVDLNLGCPQNIARKGHYGAFLMDEWHLVSQLINTLHRCLSVPVTAKIRVFDDVEKTVQYAQMIRDAGAQMITVHGRTRDMKGQQTGLADWLKVKAVREAITDIPVFSNGNILYHRDIDRCMKATGCDGVMISESNLNNPALMTNFQAKGGQLQYIPEFANDSYIQLVSDTSQYPLLLEHPPAIFVAAHYMKLVQALQFGHTLRLKAHNSMYQQYKDDRNMWERTMLKDTEHYSQNECIAIRGHVFKMLRLVLNRFPHFRPRVGACCCFDDYMTVLADLQQLVEQDIASCQNQIDMWNLLTINGSKEMDISMEGSHVENGFRLLPYWVLQPYIRAPVSEDGIDKENADLIVKKQKHESNIFNPSAVALSAEESRSATLLERDNRKKRKADHRFIMEAQKQERIRIYGEAKVKNAKLLSCDCGTVASMKCIGLLCKNCCRHQFVRQIECETGFEKNGRTYQDFLLAIEMAEIGILRKIFCQAHLPRSWSNVIKNKIDSK